ncbi:unnamed protein product, partial [Ectocarpus sp. 13 AM-2016]
MKPLYHDRAEKIAVTFTQNPSASQTADHNNCSSDSGTALAPPMFGEDSMRECPLERSILGSIIPTLDPDAPQPFRMRKNASFADDAAPPEEPGSKLPLSTGRSGAAEPEGGVPRDRAGGDGGVAVTG